MTLIVDIPFQDRESSKVLVNNATGFSVNLANNNTNILSDDFGPGNAYPRTISTTGMESGLIFPSVSLTGNFTVGWFSQLFSSGINQAILGASGFNGCLRFQNTNGFRLVGDNGASTTFTPNVLLTEMQHYTVTRRASDGFCKFYQNGQLHASGTSAAQTGTITFNTFFTGQSAVNENFKGRVAGFRIYKDEIRTDNQIDFDFQLGVVGATGDPYISSNGGGASAEINYPENSTGLVTSVVVNGTGPFSYSLTGLDASRFSVSVNGEIYPTGSFNYESLNDSNTDGIYEFAVLITGASGTDNQSLRLTLTNVNENTPGISSAPSVTSTTFRLVGEVLTCSTGAWTGATPTGYLYSWYRATSTGGQAETLISQSSDNTYLQTLPDSGKYITCKLTAFSPYGSGTGAAPYTVVTYGFVRPETIPISAGFSELSGFSGQFIYNESISDNLGVALPNPLTLNLSLPVNTVDFSFCSVRDSAVGITGSGVTNIGITLISPSFGVTATHGGTSIGSTTNFRNPLGGEQIKTVSAYWDLGDDLRLIQFSSPTTGINPIAICVDSSAIASKKCLGLECNRHLNLMRLPSGLDNTDSTVTLDYLSSDVLEGGDSGKPAIILCGIKPILVVTAWTTAFPSGPNPSYFIDKFCGVLTSAGEVPILVDFAYDDCIAFPNGRFLYSQQKNRITIKGSSTPVSSAGQSGTLTNMVNRYKDRFDERIY
jgi:hypothetical protein